MERRSLKKILGIKKRQMDQVKMISVVPPWHVPNWSSSVSVKVIFLAVILSDMSLNGKKKTDFGSL